MYYLVVDGPPDRPVHVFLARPSKLGATPVRIILLALDERAGQPHAPRPVRAAVGRSPADPDMYIEFPSEDAAVEGGFEPVGLYRVCDVWDDYLDPWPVPLPAPQEAGPPAAADEQVTGTDKTTDTAGFQEVVEVVSGPVSCVHARPG